MLKDCISYQDSGYFTPLIVDYLNRKPELESLYQSFPSIENLGNQIKSKQKSYNASREVLASVLKTQYANITMSDLTRSNIELIQNHNTFTITTGHQLNLFSGPLYFLYKIINAINLAKELKLHYPEFNFVPVYWMATEDHDFEEINHFNFKGKKFRWNRESSGAVGRLSTEGLADFFEVFSGELGAGQNAEELRRLFSESYIGAKNLTEATRKLADKLFSQHGLVCIDGDDPELKRMFAPHLKQELTQQFSYHEVQKTIGKLNDYNIQVNPREINVFYLDENLRERIILSNGKYLVNNTKIEFSESEILALLESNPEKFSPNVILRPLYQEVILPNLCYIGGGGEIAYWLELKDMFDAAKVTFPILLLRNSALLATAKQDSKVEKLQLSWSDLFLKPDQLSNKKIKEYSALNLDFTAQKAVLQKQFADLKDMATKTDASFTGAVLAQEAKQLKGLENLERRLLKAEKRNHSEKLERIAVLHDELFPNGALQERFSNFSEFYLEYGANLIATLIQSLDPLSGCFAIIIP